MGEEKTCFVIAPIGEPGSDTRKRSDQVLKHVIAPAVEPRGYKTERADQIAEPGMITPQVIDRVRDSDLVIADLAGSNPNVFYELAIRHAERKPLVQIMAEGEDIPFDVQDMRTISLDIHDLDSVDEARQEICKQVDVIESGDFEMNTPISVALDLRALKDSGDPEQSALAAVLEGIAELKGVVLRLQASLGSSEHRAILQKPRNSITLLGPDGEALPEGWFRLARGTGSVATPKGLVYRQSDFEAGGQFRHTPPPEVEPDEGNP